MAKITPVSQWETDLDQLGPWEAAQGGGNKSPLNVMLQKLANRAEFLKNQADALALGGGGGGAGGGAGGGGAAGPVATDTGAVLTGPRHMQTAVPLPNGQAFLVGGYDVAGAITSTANADMILDETYTNIDIAAGAVATASPSRNRPAAYNPIDGLVYVGAGLNGDLSMAIDWYTVNPTTGAVGALGFPNPIHHAGMIVYCPDGNLRLCGGLDNADNILNTRWLWDGFSWNEEIAFITGPPLYGASHVVDTSGKVYFFGGYTALGVNNFDVWQTDSDLSNPVVVATLTDNSGAALVADNETRVSACLINPGRALVAVNEDVFTYSFVTNTQLSVLTFPGGIKNPALTPGIDGHVLATGGTGGVNPLDTVYVISNIG